MARPKFTQKKLSRLETTTRVIKGTNKLLYLLAAVAFGLLIVATAFPQKRESDKIQAKLREIEQREQEVLEVKENREIELYALRQDQAYLEVQARDRLNYYLEGEKILRFERDQ
jgi:cell division protein FtsB